MVVVTVLCNFRICIISDQLQVYIHLKVGMGVTWTVIQVRYHLSTDNHGLIPRKGEEFYLFLLRSRLVLKPITYSMITRDQGHKEEPPLPYEVRPPQLAESKE